MLGACKVKLILCCVSLALLLSACTPSYLMTAPGAAMPGFIAVCTAHDAVGRCRDWTNKTDQCVNPNGSTEPPVVSCASIKHPQK